MIRTTLLAATSVAALSLTISGAAACTISATTATCVGATGPFASASAALAITVQTGATVTSTNRNTPAFRLSGADQSLANDGTIANTDAGNNADAIVGSAPRLAIDNTGSITSGDRAIQITGGGDDFTLVNQSTGTISSRRQAVRVDGPAGASITNFGTISSLNGRAIQARGTGTTVINHGTLTGGEEVIEGRLDFTLENTGTIVIKDGVEDEDGVQFASGTLKNWNLIQGSDDGIDIDEGTIWNYATGRIISKPAATDTARAGNAIDADDLLQDEAIPEASQAQAGLLTIHNAGLISGPRAISGAEGRTGRIEVYNTGTLEGVDTAAIDFALSMAGSLVKLSGNSTVIGSVLMTDNDDVVEIGALTSGALLQNITDGLIAVFDGRGGDDTVHLGAYGLPDILSLSLSGTEAVLNLATTAGTVSGIFRNFEFWKVGDTTYTTAELAALAPIPVPGGLPLLGAGLGALWVLRRRRAA